MWGLNPDHAIRVVIKTMPFTLSATLLTSIVIVYESLQSSVNWQARNSDWGPKSNVLIAMEGIVSLC